MKAIAYGHSVSSGFSLTRAFAAAVAAATVAAAACASVPHTGDIEAKQIQNALKSL